ncbi:nuclease-related domain-containing protein [Neobacillus terrae]|uniref:nuclease-related domain-containing protein n=1 Tax=Neobacillus terrae TaxID=3034837 RepID=UPI00140C93B9|nr:nuclease-related domain-containing protein [Neobacillus terrae]NHM32281.1 NERD domain-containing protein [Neobacillus terrae]
MLYKPRTKPEELEVLEILHTRMNLSDKDRQHSSNLKKGFEGEIIFDSLIENLKCECLILNDLLLHFNNTTFQLDSLIISSETIFLYEVKNYEGDYFYESDRLYKKPKFEIINPLNQLRRSESQLRQLLHHLGFQVPIDASVVFINSEFTLYQAPLNIPFIFHSQLNQHLRKLNNITSKLNNKHKILADKLVSLHNENFPYRQLPPYDYEQLHKGITCVNCNSFSLIIKGKKVFCTECGHVEMVATAVIRSVKEFKYLFSDRKINTNEIHEWCKIVNSKKRIKRILDKEFKMSGVNRWAFYQ